MYLSACQAIQNILYILVPIYFFEKYPTHVRVEKKCAHHVRVDNIRCHNIY